MAMKEKKEITLIKIREVYLIPGTYTFSRGYYSLIF
jgi:hypothetical protein